MAKKQVAAHAGGNGAKLWRDVLGRYDLEVHEEALLKEMVRTVDLLDKLHVLAARQGAIVTEPHGSKPHPALVEARQQKVALARLTAALRLPAGDENDNPATAARTSVPHQRRFL